MFEKFFDANILSIEIGGKNTKLILGRQHNKGVHVEKVIIFPTPGDAYMDGKIIDVSIMKEAIHGQLLTHKLKVKKGICTVESTAVISREIILPFAKEEELASMVQFEVQQYLPIMLNEYVIEYKKLEEFYDNDVKKLRVLVAAMPKTMVEGYYQLLQGLKLTPVALDTHSNALSKLVERGLDINNGKISLEKTVMFIDLGHMGININILQNGVLRYNRLIPQGARDIDISIANMFNVSLEDAEKKKKEYGELLYREDISSSEGIIVDLIKGSIDGWLQDIQRNIQYFTSRSTENRIHEIYIYGGSVAIAGLTDYIARNLNIPTFKVSKINTIKYAKSEMEECLSLCLNGIASLIRK